MIRRFAHPFTRKPLSHRTSSRARRRALGRALGILALLAVAAAPTFGDEPQHIAAYRGFSNGERVWVTGRLLADEPLEAPAAEDGWWDNLEASLDRWESDEVADATVRLEVAGRVKSVVTDEEGYYHAEFAIDGDASRFRAVSARHGPADRALTASHPISLLDPAARFLIVSDLDDTVIETGLTDLARAARRTFLENARTRRALPGVDVLYRALARGDATDAVHPVFYLSDSSWNLYDLLHDFLKLNGLPEGPILLRDVGLGSETSDHKSDTLTRLLHRFAPLPVVLLGDSGQDDAEVYAQIARKHPDRVRAIFIRDVDPDEASEHDESVDKIIADHRNPRVPFRRVRDSATITREAVELGLLPRSALQEIGAPVAPRDASPSDRPRDR